MNKGDMCPWGRDKLGYQGQTKSIFNSHGHSFEFREYLSWRGHTNLQKESRNNGQKESRNEQKESRNGQEVRRVQKRLLCHASCMILLF